MDVFGFYESLFRGVLLPLWPLWIIIAIIGAVALAYSVGKWRRLGRAGMNEIDRMTGSEFEECLELMFNRLGYQVHRTPYTGDWGADLVLTRDGIKTAVQAKHRSSGRVGVTAVQQIVAAKAKYQCGATMVVTNRAYTTAAIALAKPNGVAMCDRNKLIDMLTRSHRPQFGDLPASAATRLEPPHCHQCAKRVSDRVRVYCLENSKRFGGRIFCMTHQRAHANRV